MAHFLDLYEAAFVLVILPTALVYGLLRGSGRIWSNQGFSPYWAFRGFYLAIVWLSVFVTLFILTFDPAYN